MQWLASERAEGIAFSPAEASTPYQRIGFGSPSPESEAVREQSAFRQSTASGTAAIPVRMLESVWVISP